MIPPKSKMAWRMRTGAVLAMTALIAVLIFWLPARPIPSADAEPAEIGRYFKKAGVIQIPRIPPPMDFALADLSGATLRLSDLKGKVVILNFWTTWCPDCRVEMPAMEKLYQRFKERGVVMLAVDLREPPKIVRQFFESHKLSFTALLDSDGQVGRSFGIRSIPTTFIIDQSGGIIGKAIGSRKWDSSAVAALFELLLDNPPDDHPDIGEQVKE